MLIHVLCTEALPRLDRAGNWLEVLRMQCYSPCLPTCIALLAIPFADEFPVLTDHAICARLRSVSGCYATIAYMQAYLTYQAITDKDTMESIVSPETLQKDIPRRDEVRKCSVVAGESVLRLTMVTY